MGYKDKFPEKAYVVLIEHEILGRSFAEIGKSRGCSTSNIRQQYMTALRTKQKLYLSEILRKSDITYEILNAAYRKRRNLYAHLRYAIAYLEMEYSDILTPYREGEPGSPYALDSYRDDFDDPPTTIYRHGTQLNILQGRYMYARVASCVTLSRYVMWRVELTEMEKCVIDLKAASNSFIKIGEVLRVTPEKAKDCYKHAQSIIEMASECARPTINNSEGHPSAHLSPS